MKEWFLSWALRHQQDTKLFQVFITLGSDSSKADLLFLTFALKTLNTDV